jgi:hypothetical protein
MFYIPKHLSSWAISNAPQALMKKRNPNSIFTDVSISENPPSFLLVSTLTEIEDGSENPRTTLYINQISTRSVRKEEMLAIGLLVLFWVIHLARSLISI